MSKPTQPNIQVMSNEKLFEAAPSIFSDSPIESASSLYHFVKTSDILDIFRKAGFFPILAGEAKSRTPEGQPYVKHIIQFRSLENLLKAPKDGLFYDICLKNSHNLTSSFSLELACFRLVCQNLLTLSADQLLYHRIIHKGFQESKIKKAIEEIANYIPTIEKEFELMKQTTLNDVEALALSKTAVNIRFDISKHDVDPHELVSIKRDEDAEPTAFNIYNRLQESIINGGVKLKHKETKKVTRSKTITAIDERSRLNKELHKTMQLFMSLKSKTYQIAA